MKSKVLFSLIILASILPRSGQAQNLIKPLEGYTPKIGIMVAMLEDIKFRTVEQVKDLTLEETDYLFDEKANSIGAMIMHIVATESYFQVETLEGRQWTAEEAVFWSTAGGLGEDSRVSIKGEPISYYLELWDSVRQKTLEGFRKKDDNWLASRADEGLNYHWAWYHILKHTANHMGQIAVVKSRLPE